MALTLRQWRKYIKPQCLTINDVKQLNKGDTLYVLVMDRNLTDITNAHNKCEEIKRPKDFFECNVATYVHNKDLQGDITFHFGGFEDKKKSRNLTREFEFDIEYDKNCWYPLTNGYLPVKDPQGLGKFRYNSPKHYSMFSPTTRIGWRGPMIEWDKLDILPPVYWNEELEL